EPIAVRRLPVPQVVPVAAPAEDSLTISVRPEGSKEMPTDTAVPSASTAIAKPILLPARNEAKELASAVEKVDEVHVLRDVSATEAEPSVSAEKPVRSEGEV